VTTLRTHDQLLALNAEERETGESRIRESYRRRLLSERAKSCSEIELLRSGLAQLKTATEAEVFASIDDRIRTVGRILFEPEWKNISETYWLIGPITIENRRGVPASLDGHLEASHSSGPLRFHVEGTPFPFWVQAMRATHQASMQQLILPARIEPQTTVRGIALVHFPTSELGGVGRYREDGQKLRFILKLNDIEAYWAVALRLPYEWNPRPTPSLGRKRV